MSYQRTMNSFIALCFSAKFFKKNLTLSRLYTQKVEYIFGYMRRLSYGKGQADVVIRALPKQQISKDSLYIRGRIAVSEKNIDDITSDWKLNIGDVSSENIANEIIQDDTETAQLLNSIFENAFSVILLLNTKKRFGYF